MKHISNFFTLYWIIYFPTCIAFYTRGAFEWIDEILTVIMIGFTFLYMRMRGTEKSPLKEVFYYIGILTFFVLYGLIFGENIPKAVLRDMVQWVRPFAMIYCTWLLNPHFSRIQKNVMLFSMIATLVSCILFNEEIKIGAGAESPVLGQMAMCTGLAWLIWKPDYQWSRYIAIGLILVGMLAPKFKYLGEVIVSIYMLFFLKGKLRMLSPTKIASLLFVLAVILYVTWSKFDAYYVSGADSTELARPMTYRIGFTQILWEYFPFGPGMGTWGSAAAADYYSPLLYKYHMDKVWGCTPDLPMFVADAFYPTLCQLGVVGIFFFCVFWKRRLQAFNAIEDMRYYGVAWITFFCLVIEQTADTSFLSGKGMGYCMLIGLCLNANRNLTEEWDEEEEESTTTDDGEGEEEDTVVSHVRDDYWLYHKKG